MSDDTDPDDVQPGYEKATRSALSRFADIVENNARLGLVLVFVVAILQWTGLISLGLPAWWPIGLVVLVVAGLAAYLGGQAIDDEIPEDEKVLLVDQGNQRIHKLSTDRFGEIDKEGELHAWEGVNRCFEVSEYIPSDDRAVGTWRSIPPHSSFRDKQDVESVEDQIENLRENVGPLADMAPKLINQLPGIARQMDVRRSRSINKMVQEATVDAPVEDEDKIEAVLSDVLDDEINPFEDAKPGRDDNGEEPTPDAGEDKNGSEKTVNLDMEAIEELGGLT